MSSDKVHLMNEVIRNRRSIFPAQYDERQIDPKIIEEALENANYAPTHKMTEPWRFKVLTGEAKARLADFMADRYRKTTSDDQFLDKKYQKIKSNARRAGAVILICMQRDPEERIPEWEELASVATAVQNMWLTCSAHGLGAYWSSPPFIKDMHDFIKMNQNEKCIGIFYMGHYSHRSQSVKRSSIESKVEWINE